MQSYFIRNTLITPDILNNIPEERKSKVLELSAEFRRIGYIDVTVEVGPDQWRRTTDKQRKSISDKMIQAFRIEDKIKELIKPDEQLNKEAAQAAKEAKQKRIAAIGYRLRDIETYLQRKLQSNRMNPTKKEHSDLKTELTELQNSL